MSENTKAIGNLNGRWAFLLKLFLATYPLVIAWGGWVTWETIRCAESHTSSRMAEDLRTVIRDVAAIDRKIARIESRWEEYDRLTRQ